MNKSNRIEKLYDDYHLLYKDEQVVVGDGNVNCPLMMIGEAPGKDEVLQGKPFVGLAGGKLKEFIDFIGKTREDFFVTNAIKYRLYKVNEKTGRLSNRPAKVNEIKENRKWLLSEIDIIKPLIIITLGNVPLKSLLGNFQVSIGDYHGKLISVGDTKVYPLYHPASLIYNRALEPIYIKDLENLKKYL